MQMRKCVNEYSCVNMKFSYKIAARKDEILSRKQGIF